MCMLVKPFVRKIKKRTERERERRRERGGDRERESAKKLERGVREEKSSSRIYIRFGLSKPFFLELSTTVLPVEKILPV